VRPSLGAAVTRDPAPQLVTNLFRHRGGALIAAAALTIADCAVVIGLALLLWHLF
jgi:hypothetical protein